LNGVEKRQTALDKDAFHILLVDDNLDTLSKLDMILERAGYTVATVACASQALCLAAEVDFHVAVVDYCPDCSVMDGLQLISRLNVVYPLIVCLLMTAHNNLAIGFRASKAGAFNCLIKPFSHQVLLDQVCEALIERRRRERVCGQLQAGVLVMDLVARRVTMAGKPIMLSELEFNLLTYLASHSSRVVDYEEMWHQVWDYRGPPAKNTIYQTVRRVRKKLGEGWIVCVRRSGYCLQQASSRQLQTMPPIR
jgi:DNA-binding response OmpR family regulator